MHFARDGIVFPDRIEAALNRFFEFGAKKDFSGYAHRLSRLWNELAVKRGRDFDSHYSLDRELALAYAAYYLPANLLKVPLVLEEARLWGLDVLEKGSKTVWLDIGTGPGTALWGLAWWARELGFDLEFTGADQSENFLDVASRLSGELKKEFPVFSSDWLRVKRNDLKIQKILKERKPRVLSFVNSLSELAPDLNGRIEIVERAIGELKKQAASEGGRRWLLLIEPALQTSTRDLLEVRKAVSGSGVRIWLPCLDNRECGALAIEKDWCHETVECEFPRWFHGLGEAAGLQKESLLFSYVLMSVGEGPVPPRWPADGLRSVSQRMAEKGQLNCFLCTKSGKVRTRLLDSRRTPENEPFAEVSRGEVFASLDLNEKKDVLRLSRFEPEGITVFPRLR